MQTTCWGWARSTHCIHAHAGHTHRTPRATQGTPQEGNEHTMGPLHQETHRWCNAAGTRSGTMDPHDAQRTVRPLEYRTMVVNMHGGDGTGKAPGHRGWTDCSHA